MDKSRSSRIIKSASALLAVIIIVVVILLINQKRRIDEIHEMALKEVIEFNQGYDERLSNFYRYADVRYAEKCSDIEKRANDYGRCATEEYGAVHISMWNIDALNGDSFPELFGYPIVYADYMYKTPMELRDYLSIALESGNNLAHFYINIDPYILEKNYLAATYYDTEAVSFEEYIHNEIFPIFDAYPEVSFELFLPAKPTSYWVSLQTEQYSAIIDKWYTFLMYLHWCPNAVVRYLGDQEWLVSNDYNYESSERFTDEVMPKAYLYLYAYAQYEINGPELKQKKGTLDRYIRKENNGDYNIVDLSGKKIVFLGDDLFDYPKQDSVTISGVVKRMTNAECYNISLDGTLASSADYYGFARVANAIAMRGAPDIESRSRSEALRFAKDYSDGDSVIFVISYGLNDYKNRVPITVDDLVFKVPESEGEVMTGFVEESTFKYSYGYGLESLRLAFPKAEFLVVLPYKPVETDKGNRLNTEDYNALDDYITVIEEICMQKGINCCDMYHDGTVNKTNMSDYLIDGTHTNENGAFMLGALISEMLKGMVN